MEMKKYRQEALLQVSEEYQGMFFCSGLWPRQDSTEYRNIDPFSRFLSQTFKSTVFIQ